MVLLIFVCNFLFYRWYLFYKLVVGLVFIDGGGILFFYFFILIWYVINFIFNFGSFLCGYIFFFVLFIILFFVLIVCVMFIDWCVVVYRLFYYKSEYGDRWWVVVVIGVIWVVGGFVFSLYFVGFGFVYKFYFGFWFFLNFISGNILECVNFLIYLGLGIFVFLIIVILNFLVIVVIFYKKYWVYFGCFRKDVYNIVFFFVIVFIFSICWVLLMVRFFGFIMRFNSCGYL